ncbi:putative RING finger protein [Aspergillus lucknowensis]|uniref:RING-type E3 ubiquitin transferase n=1 Tax=Aspergillus lucknowensis TaxID=176173 RepID=A0ABR4M058_9EURO
MTGAFAVVPNSSLTEKLQTRYKRWCGGSKENSGATLGYLAPICVAVFFIFVWILVGTRHRFRASSRPIDPEGWPLSFPHATLTSTELDSRFPLAKYGTWLTAHRKCETKEAEVDPPPSQAPASPSTPSFDPGEKEACAGGAGTEDDVASTHTSDSHMECAICMESFDLDDSIRSLTCGHIFHATCLDPWFTKRQARCPLCKTCYPPDLGSSSAPTRPPAVLLRNQIFPRVI